jgi:hypothetical protein
MSIVKKLAIVALPLALGAAGCETMSEQDRASVEKATMAASSAETEAKRAADAAAAAARAAEQAARAAEQAAAEARAAGDKADRAFRQQLRK